MEIELLRQIVHLSKTLNFCETAKRLYISQPTLSKHVKSIESILDVPLFIRGTRSVHLTKAGREFVIDAEKVVRAYDEAFENHQKRMHCENATVTIGYNDIMPEEWEEEIVRGLHKIRPNLEIKLKLCNPSKMIDMLKDETIDLAVAAYFPGMLQEPTLYTHKFEASKLALVCPSSHPLSEKKSVRLEEFRDEMMLVSDTDIAAGQPMCDFYASNRFTINEESRFSSFFEASAMVSLKHGLALLPNYVSGFSFMNVHFIPIEDVDLYVEPMMLWKKFGNNRLMKSFSSYFLAE